MRLDPNEYQGFAWGMGIDRIAMLKYGMNDLRAFFEADVRWLAHYGFRPLDFRPWPGLELMSSLGPARWALDRAFFALVTRGWDARKIDGYEASLRKRDNAMSAEVSRTLGSIDAKATGLLTHTSMMIAGLGLIAPLVADNDIEVGIVVTEMAIYLLIALGCLR